MKTSHILELVKARLLLPRARSYPRSYPRYICVTLASLYENKQITERDFVRVQSIIHERLGVHHSLELWLKYEHNIDIITDIYDDTHKARAFRKRMHKTRLAWVDSMIQEFSSKGN